MKVSKVPPAQPTILVEMTYGEAEVIRNLLGHVGGYSDAANVAAKLSAELDAVGIMYAHDPERLDGFGVDPWRGEVIS